MHAPTSHRTRRPHRLAALTTAIVASLAIVSTAAAHDFWLIPHMFAFSDGSTVHVNGQSGTRFATGTPVQPSRVAEARVIGAASEAKITEMVVEGTALLLSHKPAAAGQYLIVAALTPPLRPARATPAGLIRFLRAEGGAAEAARLERDSAFTRLDTVVYASRSYAATVVQVGNGGPRAFAKSTGYPLEFVPLADPARLRVGDTLHIKILGNGKPVANIGIDATPAADTAAAAGAAGSAGGNAMVSIAADGQGVVHLPLTKAGPWMLRSAFVSAKAGTSNEFDVARATYTFGVGAR